MNDDDSPGTRPGPVAAGKELTEYQEGLLEIVRRRIPATAVEVATALGLLSGEIEKTRLQLDDAEASFIEKAEEHGRAYDLAFLAVAFDPADPAKRITEKVREAMAREKTWELRLAMEQAKVEVRRLKRRIDILDRRIFVGQSMAKTIRSEHNTVGYGQWGT